MDAQANLAYSLVAAAPSPAASGLTLDVTAGTGTRFPAVPFNATIWPASTMPTPANAEIVRVTNITTDTLTITRAQEGTSARTVIVGDQIAATVTKLTFDDVVSTIGVASALATTADSHAGTASAAATSADAHAAAASAAATSVDARVNTVSNLVSALTSAHNALSNIVSDSLSIGDVASNLLSNEISARAASIQTLSAAVTSVDTHAAAASAAATSVDGRVNSVNTFLSGISALSAGGVSTHGLQSVINALSNRISAVVGGTGSVTSTEVSAGDAAVSAQAASALSAKLVLGHVIGSSPPTRILSAIATVEGTTLTVVSGLSVTVSAGVTYKMELVAFVNRVTTQVTGFGLKFPPLVGDVQGGGIFQTWSSLVQSVGAGGAGMQPWRADASGSILVSVSTGGTASTVVLARGILVVSTGGEVALLAKASVSPSHCLVQPGSYLELKRLA